MLDMGFKPAVSRIVARRPTERQTLFFSATLEGATGKIAAAFTRDARRHTQAKDERDTADIEHRFLHVDSQSAKLDHLVAQLRGAEGSSTLVFVRTKRGADRLAKRLRSHGLETLAMHGDKSQRQRERALAQFDAGEVDALIATDVAARGIDVAGVTHVINYDAPADRDSYVHRVGRTGRAGRTGTGISFVLADQADEVRRMAGDLGLAREFNGAEGSASNRRAAPTASETTQGPAAASRRGQGEPPRPRQRDGPATAAGWPSARSTARRFRSRRAGRAGAEGEFCLACRRARAAEEALAATPDECSTEVRAKARRAGLIEFEVRRTPTLTDNTIARACRTSASAVAAARKRLNMGESPPPAPTATAQPPVAQPRADG